jgi:tRNA(Ile)-lysidine synthase
MPVIHATRWSPVMRDIESLLRNALAEPPSGGIVLAFSGGMDSTVLLHALTSQPHIRSQGLRAIHVDHRLHPGSADWARRCGDACRSLHVPIEVVAATVVNEGEGPEAAARRARWRVFANALQPGEVLALAHHRDDQAETVLLRLMRGAGPAGLAAMSLFSVRADGLKVWRPLLDVARSELRRWADSVALEWIDDPANADAAFDRNHLRHVVLPALRERWPAVDAMLHQVARRQADAHALERDAAAALMAKAATPDPRVIRLAALRAAPRHARWVALREWLSLHGARDIGAAQLRRIDAELIEASDDAEPRIDLGDCILRRHRDAAHALRRGDDDDLDYRIAWTGCEPLFLPGATGRLRLEPSPAEPLPMVITTRTGGERLRLRHDGPRRQLKHLLQESGVPTWQRGRWPVILFEGEPAAFADVVVGAALQTRLDAVGARLHFDPH